MQSASRMRAGAYACCVVLLPVVGRGFVFRLVDNEGSALPVKGGKARENVAKGIKVDRGHRIATHQGDDKPPTAL